MRVCMGGRAPPPLLRCERYTRCALLSYTVTASVPTSPTGAKLRYPPAVRSRVTCADPKGNPCLSTFYVTCFVLLSILYFVLRYDTIIDTIIRYDHATVDALF